ncbi:MAG: IPT/TIG domain-containing protein [Gammaproteobacteria bacterium]|nr:IPT/TIG domain-containing protein [Gammaproteobacteria bacterium]
MYDDLGRLVEAVDTAANKATYVYDADGNLVSVTQAAATQVAVLNFNPKQGAVGTSVVISGSGFSATLASNAVKFNGVVATVTAATSTALTVVVPTGATTCLINVTSPTGTASSATNFVIGNFLPVISGFTPAIGSVDTPVTITGSNFDAVPKANRVEFNNMIASVTSGTTASIATTVLRNTGSGPIRVTTPNGSALSSTDFFVVPNPDSSSNVATTARINVGDTASASLAAGKAALYIFNGIANQLLAVGVSGVTSTNLTVSVLLPDGSTLAAASFGTAGGGGGLQLPVLPKSGVYTVYVKAAIAGNATITIAPPMTGTLTVGGAPLSLNITPPGRRALISFAGTVGQAVDLAITGVTLSASRVSILKADGTELIAASVTTAGGMLRPILTEAGMYTIKVDPIGSIGGAITLALVMTPAASLPIDSSFSGASTSGQGLQLTFRGTVGQFLNVGVQQTCTTTPGATITVLKPDGTALSSTTMTTIDYLNCPSNLVKRGTGNPKNGS